MKRETLRVEIFGLGGEFIVELSPLKGFNEKQFLKRWKEDIYSVGKSHDTFLMYDALSIKATYGNRQTVDLVADTVKTKKLRAVNWRKFAGASSDEVALIWKNEQNIGETYIWRNVVDFNPVNLCLLIGPLVADDTNTEYRVIEMTYSGQKPDEIEYDDDSTPTAIEPIFYYPKMKK